MKIVKLISFLVVGVVVFCFLKASADIDVILKPGEAKSIQVEKEEVVNMACVQAPPPDNDEFKFIKLAKKDGYCEFYSAKLQRFKEETPGGKPISLSANCDQDKNLIVKIWGVPVGGRGNFIYKGNQGCMPINFLMMAIDELTSDQGTLKTQGTCDDKTMEGQIKLTAIRFK